MRLSSALADLQTLASGPVIRRGCASAAIVLLERVLGPVIALTLFGGGGDRRNQALVAIAFGLVFTVRGFVQRTAQARNEAELFERATASVLDGDVLRAELLPDQDVVSHAFQGVYHASNLLSQVVPGIVADLVACVVMAVFVAVREPPRIVLVAAGVLVLAAVGLLLARRAVASRMESAWKTQERVYEAFTEVLEGRFEIVASGRRGAFLHEMKQATRAWSTVTARVAAASILSGRLALVAVAGIVGLALLAHRQLGGSLPVTDADLALFASITPAFVGASQGAFAFMRDARWIHFVAGLLRHGDRPIEPATASMPQLPAVTRFDEVSFSYEGAQEPALTGVELEWRPGEVLALAGLNGSGKSTCLRVLLRLGSLKGGVVRVGGASLAELGADEWRTKVAFLPQRPYIPARASVRAAVAWPFQTIPPSDERILKALDRVGLLPTLRATEDKPLEVRVDTLSVGQRQRVALARLLCRDASVFLLDEPDANLDRAGIALVESLLRELAQQGMVAFAAHTPELVVVADHVLALEKGRVVSEPTSSRRRS